MKKNILLLSYMYGLSVLAGLAQNGYGWIKENAEDIFSSPVKHAEKTLTWTHDPAQGDIVDTSGNYTEIIYDENDRITTYRQLESRNGVRAEKHIYYNAAGRVDSIVQEGYIMFDEPVLNFAAPLQYLPVKFWTRPPLYDGLLKNNRTVYTYSPEGLLLQITYSYFDPFAKTTTTLIKQFTYEKETLKRIDDYAAHEKLIGSYTFTYDASGTLTEIQQLKGGEKIKTKYVFSYYKNPIRIRQVDRVYLVDGELTGHEIFNISENQQELTVQSMSSYTNNKPLNDYAVKTTDGKVIGLYTYMNDFSGNSQWQDSVIYTNASSGLTERVTSIDTETGKPVIMKRTYIFDSKNNWTEMQVSENGEKKYTVMRKIVYKKD